MRTTLDLPQKLISEALKLTHCKTKTGLIKIALENLIQREKIKEIKKFKGKIKLNINLDALRQR